jgi:UDP-3-O-[3-hydroxymyristoyl] glucosamine N-acyltransferase
VNSLDKASKGEISFFTDKRYQDQVQHTGASALLVSKAVDIYHGPQVVVSDARLAQAKIIAMFSPPEPRFPGISKRAFIAESCKIGDNVSVYPMAYVGDGAVLGDDVTLYPGVFIGERVWIGNGTMIYPNVTITHDCIIGQNVIIHPGTVIGSHGFGFVKEAGKNVKVHQIGIVQIDDDVEIGANNCIDRAALGKTWIKRGVKTDNLIQVAHNVVIGEETLIAAQTGISGSVEIGRDVVMGGQVGMIDHLKIGDRAMIAPGSGLAKHINQGEIVSGRPGMPHRHFLRVSRLFVRLPEIFERLKGLEKKVEAILKTQGKK